MDNDENKGRTPTQPDAVDGAPDPKIGPVGLTRSEDQRRRLIITSLATPALMTLPSRRVWASKCTKSKLLSGNLSAKKKKKGLQCDPMGCGASYWDGGDPIQNHENWATRVFGDELVDPLVPGVFGGATLLQVVNKNAEPDNMFERFGNDWDDIFDELKKAAREIAAAYLNALYISWPMPNDVFNFSLTVADVQGMWSASWMPPAGTPPSQVLPQDWSGLTVLDAALAAGHWANEYKKYKAIEKDDNDVYSDAEEAAAKIEKEAAEVHFKDAKAQIEIDTDDLNKKNKLSCPFK